MRERLDCDPRQRSKMLPVKVGFELEYEADDDDGEERAERFKGFENSSGQRWLDSSKTARAQAERSVERSSTLPSPPAKRGRAILLSVTGDISLLAVSAERRIEGDEGGKIGAARGVTSVTACRALLDVTYHPPVPSKINSPQLSLTQSPILRFSCSL
ncbi:uncharacterized protein UHO2_03691 [Ustilago hordei]|uniref:uncharacterized protein n=1 Tax=Ustilago hordei TaxID=120017 RepID=UPI001A6389B3|nr:uncharacterized protein UHO2_03691 [Ustilago hordei]SYW75612.1 uncharacterized protein UHO2_03691 [Ustilago hordei]